MNDFDRKAAGWDADPAKGAVADAIRARVPLGPGLAALEYGCGTGLLSFPLSGQDHPGRHLPRHAGRAHGEDR